MTPMELQSRNYGPPGGRAQVGDATIVSPASYHLFTKDRTFRVSDGTPIAYTVRGTGASGLTVVLANGWSCPDAYWAHLVPHLEERGHRVLLPDTRGHGDS